MALLIAGVVAAAVAAVALVPGRTERRRPPPGTAGVGALAPPFRLADLRRGQPDISLESLRGRPVLLNFWASWCDPCREEMPAFEAAHRRVGDRLAFLGIDRQDDRDDGLRFRARTRVTYPSAYDPEGSLDVPYGLRGMPTTVLIGPDGRILDKVSGQLSPGKLDALVDEVVRR